MPNFFFFPLKIKLLCTRSESPAFFDKRYHLTSNILTRKNKFLEISTQKKKDWCGKCPTNPFIAHHPGGTIRPPICCITLFRE